MLGRDHAGHGFEQFGNPQQRADQKVRAPMLPSLAACAVPIWA
jgi:hypothetical protein